MFRKTIVMFMCLFIIQGCGDLVVPGLAPNPSKQEILTWSEPLTAQAKKELLTWSDQHDTIYDARVHSLDTCPIYTYSPAYAKFESGQTSDAAWANFLHKFWKAKHKEQKDKDNCDCDKILGKD